MTYSRNSPILNKNPAPIDTQTLFDWVENRGAQRGYELMPFIETLVQGSLRIGIDPWLMLAQSILETDYWTSYWWAEELNPAGLGITGDPIQNSQAQSWNSGADAAKAQLAHMVAYVYGDEWLDRWPGEWSSPDLYDKRFHLVIDIGKRAKTLADLNGRWAIDKENNYHGKIATRANELLGMFQAEVEHAGDDEMAGFEYPGLTIINATDWKGSNRPGTAFNSGPLYFVEHDTANYNIGANAKMHRDFVRNGGGKDKVSFHATGDGSHTVYQLLPLDEIGWHAADGCDNRQKDWGCFASAAYEMCVNTDMSVWESYATAKEWAAAVILGDVRIDYGSRSKVDFSVDRIRSHRQASAVAWGGVGKDCSHWEYANKLFPDDFVAGVVARVNQYSRDVSTTPAPVPPELDELFPGLDYGIAARLFGAPKGEDGRDYPFSRTGPVSNLWLDRGKQTGQWPELTEVLVYDGGARRYFCFEDGWVVFAGNDGIKELRAA